MCGFISGLSFLFHWSIFLFLCQCHTVLMTVALSCNLKSKYDSSSYSFLKIAFPIQGLLCLHISFKIFCILTFQMDGSLFFLTMKIVHFIIKHICILLLLLLLLLLSCFSRVWPCPTPYIDSNPPGSSVTGILQARILEFPFPSTQVQKMAKIAMYFSQCSKALIIV